MLDAARATAVAASLGLTLRETQPCVMCLFGVGAELDRGDERRVRSALRFFAPLLWEEGLDAPVREALRRAVRDRVPNADRALADVERYGPASRVVKAVVRDLARQQWAEMQRIPLPPKEGAARWN